MMLMDGIVELLIAIYEERRRKKANLIYDFMNSKIAISKHRSRMVTIMIKACNLVLMQHRLGSLICQQDYFYKRVWP